MKRRLAALDQTDYQKLPALMVIPWSLTGPAVEPHDKRALLSGQGSATMRVPLVSGSVHTQRPVNTAKKAAREMPPPRP